MKTSQKQISLFTEDQLTSLRADSPANLSASQGSEREQRTSAICGRKCLDQFERFNHVGSWATTFSALLIGTGGWYSSRCRLTWRLRGTKYNRMYFQLQASTHRTEGTGYGLLPTPAVADTIGGPKRRDQIKLKNGRFVRTSDNTGTEFGAKLNDVARLLPTPTTMDHMAPKTDKAIHREMTEVRPGRTMLSNLRDVVIRQPEKLLPTPATRDYRGARSSEALEAAGRNGTNSLPDAFAQAGTSSQLNPRFVGEMMGFPPDWLELPFQSIETNQSKPTGTP